LQSARASAIPHPQHMHPAYASHVQAPTVIPRSPSTSALTLVIPRVERGCGLEGADACVACSCRPARAGVAAGAAAMGVGHGIRVRLANLCSGLTTGWPTECKLVHTTWHLCCTQHEQGYPFACATTMAGHRIVRAGSCQLQSVAHLAPSSDPNALVYLFWLSPTRNC